jgi:hypothetical protein
MPTVIPAMAPRAVAFRQTRPPKNAGASCAMAAKARMPMAASWESPANR